MAIRTIVLRATWLLGADRSIAYRRTCLLIQVSNPLEWLVARNPHIHPSLYFADTLMRRITPRGAAAAPASAASSILRTVALCASAGR